MTKFQNKYRIESIRLQNWDYRWNAAYFITICTKNREHYFGEIRDNKMQLSGAGVIADLLWHEIKNHEKNIELGAFQVMPNHIHGIIILNGHFVDAGHALHPQNDQPPKTIGQQRFQNIGKNSISSIIGSYKSAVTKHANRLGVEFAWQTLFYDHIIRDNNAYQRIHHYIINNPLKWKEDKFCG
jgi:putative transposase